MKNNFFDPETREEFFIPHFLIFTNNEGSVYKYKNTLKPILNPKTGKPLDLIKREGKFEAPSLMKSNNKQNRVEMLKKRSKDHYKKEIKEKRYQMNKDLVEKFK